MARQTLKFELNVPQTLALEYPEGIHVEGNYGPQVRFILTQNRQIYLDPEAANAIRILKPQPGEEFTLVKRSEPGRRIWWETERPKFLKGGDPNEQTVTGAARPFNPSDNRAASSTPRNTPENEPSPVSASKSALLPGDVKRIPPQSVPQPPPHASGLQLTKTPPIKPSYEEAFRECLRIVTNGLLQTGEQWSDGAKQAMVSTLMIQLGRENRLGAFQPQQIGKVA